MLRLHWCLQSNRLQMCHFLPRLVLLDFRTLGVLIQRLIKMFLVHISFPFHLSCFTFAFYSTLLFQEACFHVILQSSYSLSPLHHIHYHQLPVLIMSLGFLYIRIHSKLFIQLLPVTSLSCLYQAIPFQTSLQYRVLF